MGNSLGKLFTVTSFGESHGKCVGVVIDGCPAGLPLTIEDIQKEVNKRKPADGIFATARTEPDRVEILSGVFNDFTTGAPVCLLIWNKDADSEIYEQFVATPRPGHADYTAYVKYGGFNDYRGGGRFSGRITAGFVMAGAVAKKLINRVGVEVIAHALAIGGVRAAARSYNEIKANAGNNPLRCADPEAGEKMLEVIKQAGAVGDSVGGIVEGIAINLPAGLGEPVFDTLDGEMAKAMLAIPAIKGIEFGAGFAAASIKGSENNDLFIIKNKEVATVTNNAGGILGGISSGMPLIIRLAVKPTPSISMTQGTLDLKQYQPASLEIKGRHDTCIVPRVVSVVEAMMAITICDIALQAGLIPRVLIDHEKHLANHRIV
jgi:chorismate synthase